MNITYGPDTDLDIRRSMFGFMADREYIVEVAYEVAGKPCFDDVRFFAIEQTSEGIDYLFDMLAMDSETGDFYPTGEILTLEEGEIGAIHVY